MSPLILNLIFVLFTLQLSYGQEEQSQTLFVVYSEVEGYKWNPTSDRTKEEIIIQNIKEKIEKIYPSTKTEDLKFIRSKEEKQAYTPLVDEQMKNKPLFWKEFDVHTNSVRFTKLFYHLKLTIDSSLPIQNASLFSGSSEQHPEIKKIQTRTHVVSTNIETTWRYTITWQNVLLDSNLESIKYDLIYNFKNFKKKESKEILLPLQNKDSRQIVDLQLSPKNFPLPPLSLQTRNGPKKSQMSEFQFRRKESGLYFLEAKLSWKKVRPKETLFQSQDLHFDFYPLENVEFTKIPIKEDSTDHFLIFKCPLIEFGVFVEEKNGLGRLHSKKTIEEFKIKRSVILIDYTPPLDPLNSLVLKVKFEEESDSRFLCWFIYPTNIERHWIKINPHREKARKGILIFEKEFLSQGNLYNLAIQDIERGTKEIYINMPIGTPTKEWKKYLETNKNNLWNVPWLKK